MVEIVVLCHTFFSKIHTGSVKNLLPHTHSLMHNIFSACLISFIFSIFTCFGHYYSAFMLNPLRNWFSESSNVPQQGVEKQIVSALSTYKCIIFWIHYYFEHFGPVIVQSIYSLSANM